MTPAVPALGELTGAVAAQTDVLLIPLGSVEQHGPHLPVSTDSLIAREVCRRVVEALVGQGVSAAVAPCLEYGSSGEHEGFDGTISIGADALRVVLVELGRSARRWAGRLVLVTGHGGNVGAMIDAVRLLSAEGSDICWTTCAEPGFDAHAGHAETSLMLAIAPTAVRLGCAAVGNTAPVAELWSVLRSEGVRAVSPNGVLGDPRGASVEDGHRMLVALTDRIVCQIRTGRVDGDGALLRPSTVVG